jgi:polar amino acid transport system substrate-binding protein
LHRVRHCDLLTVGVIAILSIAAASISHAGQTLNAIRERGTLRWGADMEGGGPFVFPSPTDDDPDRVEGFEVEIADLIAERLGVEAEFAQNPWDRLPDVLDGGGIDIVLNGYEWSPAWAEQYGTSLPYYVYELQLLGRKSDDTLLTWDDLLNPAGGPRKVAVLGGSAADLYLQGLELDHIEIVLYDGATDAMQSVVNEIDDLDANLQDLCVWSYYQDGFPELRAVGDPVGRGYYVVFVRKDDPELLHEINEAIIESLRNGSLREILEEFGMWNETQAARALETDATGGFTGDLLSGDDGARGRGQFSVRGWDVIRQRGGTLVRAAGMTVLLAVLSMPLAILIGLIITLCRLYGPWFLALPATIYVEIVRGTPLVLQLYVIFFLLPEIGISVPPVVAAVLGLAINYSAYEAEIYRAGIQAIPKGQMEAALALGMSKWMALKRVIIPQSTRLVIPPMTNDFIALFKDTAVCSVITVVELSKEYNIQARSTMAIIELGILTALLYLAMSYPLSILAARLERNLQKGQRR